MRVPVLVPVPGTSTGTCSGTRLLHVPVPVPVPVLGASTSTCTGTRILRVPVHVLVLGTSPGTYYRGEHRECGYKG